MVRLKMHWTRIQQYRFVLQLADYTPVGLLRSPESENLLRHFPKSRITLFDRLEPDFEEIGIVHDHSPVWYCELRGCKVFGPFFAKAMLARIGRGPKRKRLTFRGMFHPWRKKELQPYLAHCLDVRREAVDKVWDPAYWADLSETEFAICPRGGCPWLYRETEAVTAFAIPAHTPEFEAVSLPSPFQHVVLGRDALAYRQADAQRNYDLMLAQMEEQWKSLAKLL